MNDLNIPATDSTPAVESDASRGVLVLRGDAFPENAYALFGPVARWIEDYLAACQAPLSLTLELQYLNTRSIKALMDIFDLLEAAHAQARQVSVTWFYDGDNARVGELVEEFREDCTFSFDIVSR
ncbi:biofilm regulation phosphoprotein SiaC [Achromobacter aloeverae]